MTKFEKIIYEQESNILCMVSDSYNINTELANQKYIQLSKKYGLNPALLKEIVILRNEGYNNLNISERTGINKNTVNKYVNALNEMDRNDLLELLLVIAVITGGAYLIGKLLEMLSE